MNQALPKRARLPLWRSFAVYAIIVAWYEGINVYTHHDPWYVAVSHMPWYVAMEHAPWYVATELMPVLLPAVVIVELLSRSYPESPRGRLIRLPFRFSCVQPLTLMALAVLIAGRMRAALVREEWRSHLYGEPGCGPLTRRQQSRAAYGFIWAAICYRAQDAADLAWKPLDAVLASRGLSTMAVYIPSLVTAVLLAKQGGLYGLLDHITSVPAVGGAMYGLIRTGRWWRGVKPPKHHPQRNKGADS